MSTVDPNTERRMERLRQQRAGAADPNAAAASKYAASTLPAQPASKPSSGASWLVGAAVAVGGGLLLRSLLRGTAPSSASRYSKLMNREAGGAAQQRAVPSTPWPSRDQSHSHHQRTHQTHTSHASHSQHHQHQQQQHQQQQQQTWTASDDYHSAQARQAAYERKWAKAQSDYARFEALQNQAREAWASGERVHKLGAYATLDRSPDAAFELEMEQARADYVQSKFHALKQSKRVTRYETWTGGQGRTGNGTAEEEEERMREEALAAGEDPDEVHSRFMAFQAIHRQLATSPKYVQARALLFSPPTATATSASSSTAGGAASLFHPSLDSSSLPPLTSQAVRAAYFQRAKQVHPDVAGGNAAQFQALTDAYELLVDALEPIEKHARERAEREATKQQQQQQQQASTGASSNDAATQ